MQGIIANYKGADILALQNGKEIAFYMNYKRSDFIFCGCRKGNVKNLKEKDIVQVWEDNFEMVFCKECIIIENCEKGIEELEDGDLDYEEKQKQGG